MKYLHFNLFALLSRFRGRKTDGAFSDFLLHAPLEKKIKIFRKAAEKANEDQREIVERYNKMRTKNAL